MYQEIQQEKIKSQWVRQILISQDSKNVAIKYQEQWLLYNLVEKQSTQILYSRNGPGMFSPDSNYFITVGVKINEQRESVELIQTSSKQKIPATLFQTTNQVRSLDINENSDKLIINFMNGSIIIWDIKNEEKVLQLDSNIKYQYMLFSKQRIIGVQQHCIQFFDLKRFKKIKKLYISGILSDYQKYTHYCDIKQINENLFLFRQSRGVEQCYFRIISNQKGKMLRIIKDCLRFENLNINISPDHKQIVRLRKIKNIEMEIVEITSGKSYNFQQCLDTKQPICFSQDWNLIIQSTKQGYSKVFRKLSE